MFRKYLEVGTCSHQTPLFPKFSLMSRIRKSKGRESKIVRRNDTAL